MLVFLKTKKWLLCLLFCFMQQPPSYYEKIMTVSNVCVMLISIIINTTKKFTGLITAIACALYLLEMLPESVR